MTHTDRAARLYNRCIAADYAAVTPVEFLHFGRRAFVVRIIERQLAVHAEDSDDDDAERNAFPPPVDLDAYAAACRLPPAEETEDERERASSASASSGCEERDRGGRLWNS